MPRPKPVTWNGIPYPSAEVCAETIGVNVATFRSWLRNGHTCDADRTAKKKKHTTKFNFMGHPFRNETELRPLMRKYLRELSTNSKQGE